jgi:hypothetical protein
MRGKHTQEFRVRSAHHDADILPPTRTLPTGGVWVHDDFPIMSMGCGKNTRKDSREKARYRAT